MKLRTLRVFLTARYERLFSRRFDLENECVSKAPVVAMRPQRNRFRIIGSIFPTDSLLPRYQY